MLELLKGHLTQALVARRLQFSTGGWVDYLTDLSDLCRPVFSIERVEVIIPENLQIIAILLQTGNLGLAVFWEPVAEFATVTWVPVTVVVAGAGIDVAVLCRAVPVRAASGGTVVVVIVAVVVAVAVIIVAVVIVVIIRKFTVTALFKERIVELSSGIIDHWLTRRQNPVTVTLTISIGLDVSINEAGGYANHSINRNSELSCGNGSLCSS